jgi:hypothetical protein
MKTLVSALLLVWVSNVAWPALSAEFGPTVSKDNANASAKASASFRQGVEFYREASFEAALAEFRKAYQLSPSYKVLYNIAQTYYELQDYVNAQSNLRQYLSEGGNEIPAERRVEVQEMFEKLGERIAYLEIDTNVADADVRIDDLSVGVSPLSAAVPVNIGRRRVSAVKPGYAPSVRVVTAAGKDRLKVKLDLTEQTLSQPRESLGTSSLVANTENARKRAALDSSRTALVTSVVVTAGLAVATGAFAWLALDAKKNFDNELNTIPGAEQNIRDARSKLKTYAYITDGLGAATVISGGVALYLALTSSSPTGRRKESSNSRSVVLAPTVGGMMLHGSW